MRGFDNRCTPSRGTSSSLHKTQAARLPDARHPRPRLRTRRAANSLFGFIDVLEIDGGRRRSEAGLLQQLRSLQPSAGGCLSSPVLLRAGRDGHSPAWPRGSCPLSGPRGLTQPSRGPLATGAAPGLQERFCLPWLPPQLPPLLRNKPSATGRALHLHPLLQTLLPHPRASPFPGNAP